MKDIDDIRRDNMLTLETEVGGPTAAASRVVSPDTGIQWSQPQWSNLRGGAKDSKTKKKRGMLKKTARLIEAAFGRHEGWLDLDHSVEDACGPKDEDEQTILKGYRLLETPIKQFLLVQARTIIKNHRDTHTHPETTESDVQLNVMAQ